jgi:hypothetical protein
MSKDNLIIAGVRQHKLGKQTVMRTGLVWQDKKRRCVSLDSVAGHLAMHAVRQSPYGYPKIRG